MALLTKLKSATLVEALIATVICLVIFFIASLILNNVILNSFSKTHHSLVYRLNFLHDQVRNNNLSIPYQEQFMEWNINIIELNTADGDIIVLEVNDKTKTQLLQKRVYAE